MEIMLPPAIAAGRGGERELFISGCHRAYELYGTLSSVGIRKEDARFILPNAALTKMKAKGNLSNWRKFIDLRSDGSSQWEIRMLSNTILQIAYEVAPSVFEDQYEKYIINDEKALFADREHAKYFEGEL
jgi:thymidylate synthase (FAD)